MGYVGYSTHHTRKNQKRSRALFGELVLVGVLAQRGRLAAGSLLARLFILATA